MNINERLTYCAICQNRKIDLKTGLLCSLTNKKPEFEDTCDKFIKDEKEAERKLKLKLAGAGNARAQSGSLHPKKNINYGIFLTILGIIILSFSLLFGAIITFTGISFFIRGKQQEKILFINEKLNEKISEKSKKI